MWTEQGIVNLVLDANNGNVHRTTHLAETETFASLKTYFDNQASIYCYSFMGEPVAWTKTPADYGFHDGDRMRLEVIGLPADLQCLDWYIEQKRAEEQQAAETKRADAERLQSGPNLVGFSELCVKARRRRVLQSTFSNSTETTDAATGQRLITAVLR